MRIWYIKINIRLNDSLPTRFCRSTQLLEWVRQWGLSGTLHLKPVVVKSRGVRCGNVAKEGGAHPLIPALWQPSWKQESEAWSAATVLWSSPRWISPAVTQWSVSHMHHVGNMPCAHGLTWTTVQPLGHGNVSGLWCTNVVDCFPPADTSGARWGRRHWTPRRCSSAL